MNDGRAVARETKAHGSHVFDTRCHVGTSAAVHARRQLTHDVQDDGDVMRGQVPSDIDVLLEQAEVQAPRRNVPDVSEIPGIDDFLDFANSGRIEESVPDHEHKPFFPGDSHQLLTFNGGGGHRFFDESVLAREQTGLGHRVMVSDRSRDYYRIQASAV